ncbi:MAG TPA: hypothetical protein VIQ50_03515, partial [Xanthobacteraceae bacterium]
FRVHGDRSDVAFVCLAAISRQGRSYRSVMIRSEAAGIESGKHAVLTAISRKPRSVSAAMVRPASAATADVSDGLPSLLCACIDRPAG